jgi:hypothetical protein
MASNRMEFIQTDAAVNEGNSGIYICIYVYVHIYVYIYIY